MSRGLGTEQRWLLDHLASEPNGLTKLGSPRWTLLIDALAVRYGDAPTIAQRQSLRRAAHTLSERGLIELSTGGFSWWVERRRDHRRVRRATWVRRKLTEQEQRAEERFAERLRKKRQGLVAEFAATPRDD